MIFFVGNDGTIVKGLPSPVYQGAANSNTVYLIAPFAENTAVTVAFKLPNGVVTAPAAMASQGAIAGVTDAATGQTYAGWTYDLPNSITSLYGTVTAQFFFYSAQAGVITATSGTSFQVGRGVPAVLPDTPEEDVYEQILSNIAALQTDVSNGYYAARAIYAWNSAMTYGANEITYYPVGTYGALVKSVVASNTNHEPYTDGVLNSTYWAEVLNFDEALTTAEEAKDAAAASAAAAAQSATAAENYKDAASDSASSAADYVTQANTAASSAIVNASAAEQSMKAAAESATAAAQSAQDAADFAELARQYVELGIQPNTDYTSVDDLPVPGSTKFIYLIPATDGSGQDAYDAYIWVPSKQAYEHIGSTRIDLSNYAQKNGSYPDMSVGNATKAAQDASGNVITATYATKAENNAKYTKPSTGIPESDLASAVQASLGKADTAYQKPSGGIPKTDLASAVQTSLNKADTALQSVPLATSSAVGGVKPVAKTNDMTQSVGVDANGALWTEPGGGGPEIPTPTTSDNGKVLGVANGVYALQEAGGGGGAAISGYTVTVEQGALTGVLSPSIVFEKADGTTQTVVSSASSTIVNNVVKIWAKTGAGGSNFGVSGGINELIWFTAAYDQSISVYSVSGDGIIQNISGGGAE